jgi:hypothetical protein
VIRFSRTDSAPTGDKPMVVWRDVTVVHAEATELGAPDRLLMEAAQRLGEVDAELLVELTEVPKTIWAAVGRRLSAMRLVTEHQGTFTPTKQTKAAIDEGTAVTRREDVLDLLFLPHSDDLVVTTGLKDFDRVKPTPHSVAPLPHSLHARRRHELVSTYIAKGKVANLPTTVISTLEQPGTPDPPGLTGVLHHVGESHVPVCPAYSCTATVTFDGDRTPILVEFAAAENGSRARERGNERRRAPALLSLDDAEGLVRAWSSLASRLGDASHRSAVWEAVTGKAGSTAPRADGPARWQLPITGDQAAALAKSGLLLEPIGLRIETEDAAVVVAVRYVPADDRAVRLFAVDETVKALLGDPATIRDRAVGMSPDQVREVGARAWELGHHWIVHILREREDFDYD